MLESKIGHEPLSITPLGGVSSMDTNTNVLVINQNFSKTIQSKRYYSGFRELKNEIKLEKNRSAFLHSILE